MAIFGPRRDYGAGGDKPERAGAIQRERDARGTVDLHALDDAMDRFAHGVPDAPPIPVGDLLAYARADIEKLTAHLAAQDAAREAKHSRLEEILAKRDREVADLIHELSALHAAPQPLTAALAARETDLARLTQELAAVRAQHEAERGHLEDTLATRDREFTDLVQELYTLRTAPQPSTLALAERDAEVTRLTQQLTQVTTTRAEQEAGRRLLEDALAARDRELADRTLEASALRATLEATPARTAPLQGPWLTEPHDFAGEPRPADRARLEARADAGRLIAAVTEDVDTMLEGISRDISDLWVQVPEGVVPEDIASRLRHSVVQGRVLLRMLRAFARHQERRGYTIDLNSVIDGTRSTLARLLGDDVTFGVELAPNLEPVAVDPLQLELALVGVVGAVRAELPAGGHVTISTSHSGPDHDVASAPRSAGHGHARLTVTAVPWRQQIATPVLATDLWLAPTPLGESLNLSQVERWAISQGGWLDRNGSSTHGVVIHIGLPSGAPPPPFALPAR